MIRCREYIRDLLLPESLPAVVDPNSMVVVSVFFGGGRGLDGNEVTVR